MHVFHTYTICIRLLARPTQWRARAPRTTLESLLPSLSVPFQPHHHTPLTSKSRPAFPEIAEKMKNKAVHKDNTSTHCYTRWHRRRFFYLFHCSATSRRTRNSHTYLSCIYNPSFLPYPRSRVILPLLLSRFTYIHTHAELARARRRLTRRRASPLLWGVARESERERKRERHTAAARARERDRELGAQRARERRGERETEAVGAPHLRLFQMFLARRAEGEPRARAARFRIALPLHYIYQYIIPILLQCTRPSQLRGRREIWLFRGRILFIGGPRGKGLPDCRFALAPLRPGTV